MRILTRFPKSLIFFWFAQTVIIAALWDFLPSTLTSNLLVALTIINGILLVRRQFDLPIFSHVALLLALSHFWLGSNVVTGLVAALVVFAGTTFGGWIVQASVGKINRDEILIWFLVGLFTAQIATLTQFWPISFFQKSMLGTAVFYLVWQSWRVIDPPSGTDKRPILAHFAFVALAVMVVLANIVWTSWPGLNTS